MRTFLENQPNSTPTIQIRIFEVPREQHAALFALINKTRMCNGWGASTAKELDPTIQVWAEAFAVYKIPISAYHELYLLAFDTRQLAYRNGKEVPKMSVELLVSGWTGDNGLKAKYKRDEINAKNLLPTAAATQCPRCFGIGLENVYSKTGDLLGCRPNCQHKPLEKGEWLFEQAMVEVEF